METTSTLDEIKESFNALNSQENESKIANLIINFELILLFDHLKSTKKESYAVDVKYLKERYNQTLQRNNVGYITTAYNALVATISVYEFNCSTLSSELIDHQLANYRAQFANSMRSLDGDIKWAAESVATIFERVNPAEMSAEDKLKFSASIHEALDYAITAATKLLNQINGNIKFDHKIAVTIDASALRDLPSITLLSQLLDSFMIDVYQSDKDNFINFFLSHVPIEQQVGALNHFLDRLSDAPTIQKDVSLLVTKRINQYEATPNFDATNPSYCALLKVKSGLKKRNDTETVQDTGNDLTWLKGSDAVVKTATKTTPISSELYDGVMAAFQKEQEKMAAKDEDEDEDETVENTTLLVM